MTCQSKEKKSVVIIGAGLAGLVSAYELNKRGIPAIIYEARDRLGGRIQTQHKFNQEGMFCELGAELVDTAHVALQNLCKELNLTIEDLEENEQGIEQFLYYHEGQTYTQKDILPSYNHFLSLVEQDRAFLYQKERLVEPTFYQTMGAEHWDNMSLKEYLERKSTQGVDKWFLELIETAYTGEYGREAEKQSALNLMLLIGLKNNRQKVALFGESDESKRIQGGTSQLVRALYQALKRKGVRFMLGHKLSAIHDKDQYVLLTFESQGQMKEIKAGRVICTIPFSVLRNVEGMLKLDLSPIKKRCIKELSYGNHTKLMVGFRKRVWRNQLKGIRSNGSLFVNKRQCWESSRKQKGLTGIMTHYLPGTQTLSLETIGKDWELLCPGMSAYQDGNVVHRSWTSSDPFSLGSYTSPDVGQYTNIIGAQELPELQGRLLFAGEHCDREWQGFMEGAIRSAQSAVNLLLAS